MPTARLDADAEREEDEVTDDSPSCPRIVDLTPESEDVREGRRRCSTSAANNVVPHPTIVRPGTRARSPRRTTARARTISTTRES